MPKPLDEQRSLGTKGILGIGTAILVTGLASTNTLLTMASLLALGAIIKLLWRRGEPPILLFAMAYHWVQACVMTLVANLRGQSLEDYAGIPTMQAAAWLTLAGVLAVALGMFSGSKLWEPVPTITPSREHGIRLSIQRLFIAALVAIGASDWASAFAYNIPALTQPLLSLVNLHWVVVFMLVFEVVSQRRGYPKLVLVIALEIAAGFIGYFSGFKNILFLTVLAILAVPGALRGVRLRMVSLITACVLLLAVVWVGIKRDYRQFLNMGTGDQVVLVPVDKRIEKLLELVGDFNREKLRNSLEALGDRLTYVSYFAEAMQAVPRVIPHEGGKLWWEAVENVLVPRFLNPDKRSVNDSERTSYYTGGWVAGVQEGTSISLGYIAESYIDFGPMFMFLPLFLWGYLVGACHRLLTRRTRYPLLGQAISTVVIYLNASILESSNVKMFGGLVMGVIVLHVFQKKAGRRFIGLLSTVSSPPLAREANPSHGTPIAS